MYIYRYIYINILICRYINIYTTSLLYVYIYTSLHSVYMYTYKSDVVYILISLKSGDLYI